MIHGICHYLYSHYSLERWETPPKLINSFVGPWVFLLRPSLASQFFWPSRGFDLVWCPISPLVDMMSCLKGCVGSLPKWPPWWCSSKNHQVGHVSKFLPNCMTNMLNHCLMQLPLTRVCHGQPIQGSEKQQLTKQSTYSGETTSASSNMGRDGLWLNNRGYSNTLEGYLFMLHSGTTT